MKYEIIKLSQDSIDMYLSDKAQQSASGYFENLTRGQKPTQRTPLYKDLSSNEVFDLWVTFLKTRMERFDKERPLIEYDLSRLEKCGPQGGLKPLDDRLSDLFEYWQLPSTDGITTNEECIAQVRKELFGSVRDKRPLTVETVVKRDQYDDKLITNSGSPDFAKRNDPSVLRKAIEDAKSGKWFDYPMILGSRSQRGKERFIFLAPFSTNIVEKQYLYPLMDHIRKANLPFFAAWEGFNAVETQFDLTNFFNHDVSYVQQDYTAMDKYFNSMLGELVFEITKDFFQSRYHEEWNKIIQHVFNIPVMTQIDKLVKGPHGLMSGSGLTNFLESIVSYYLTCAYGSKLQGNMGSQGLGDDLVFNYKSDANSEEEVKDVMFTESAKLNLVLSPDKQRFDKHTTVYLQRYFDERLNINKGNYPSILALNTAMYPERFHDAAKWSGEMETLRWIMILENCKNLPYFEDLIQFFMKGDKFKLGLEIPNFFRQLPITYEDSKSIKGFVPSYNQEGLDRNILQFATVQYLLKQSAISE
jgi:hypothetical protein